MAFLSQIIKKTHDSLDSKISEQLMYNNLEQKLNKWNIMKINPIKIYNKRFLEFRQSYVIKTY